MYSKDHEKRFFRQSTARQACNYIEIKGSGFESEILKGRKVEDLVSGGEDIQYRPSRVEASF
jgi:hypothetical protein